MTDKSIFLNIINNNLTSSIEKIEHILNNCKDLIKHNTNTQELIKKYELQTKYFDKKTMLIEDSKNLAERKNDYEMNDFEYNKSIRKYLTFIFWILVIVFLFMKYFYNKEFKKVNIIKTLAALLFVYIIPKLSMLYSVLYNKFMLSKAKQYQDLEYNILQAKSL